MESTGTVKFGASCGGSAAGLSPTHRSPTRFTVQLDAFTQLVTGQDLAHALLEALADQLVEAAPGDALNTGSAISGQRMLRHHVAEAIIR